MSERRVWLHTKEAGQAMARVIRGWLAGGEAERLRHVPMYVPAMLEAGVDPVEVFRLAGKAERIVRASEWAG